MPGKTQPRTKRSARPTKASSPRKRSGGFLRRIGFRANGGAVAAGQPVIVGERGAEMFVPSERGQIVPLGGNIQSVPGGRERFANLTRRVGQGFSNTLGRARQATPKWVKPTVISLVLATGAGFLTHAFDQAGLSPVIQGGIFAGIAVGLAIIAKVAGSAGVAVGAIGIAILAVYELAAEALAWFRTKFPSIDIPGLSSSSSTNTSSGGTTPAPAES